MVVGGLKRGWIIWIIVVVDDRVVVIVLIVIDLLNVVFFFEYYWRVYGFWVFVVGNYVEEGIMDW